jgi:hypothetical protein
VLVLGLGFWGWGFGVWGLGVGVGVVLEQLHLGAADGGGRHVLRRLHGCEHEGLQQVVLDDVAHDAEAIEVAAPPLLRVRVRGRVRVSTQGKGSVSVR